MNSKFLPAICGLSLLIFGCSQKQPDLAEAEKKLAEAQKEVAAAKANAVASKPAAVSRPKEFVLPVGTRIRVQTTNALTTKTASAGSTFEAHLMEPVLLEGVELIPKGALATGVVRNSDPGGRVKGRATISVGLKSIQLNGDLLNIETSTVGATAKGTVKKDVIRGGIMTGAGAAIGAIVGGGKGAAIGAGAGGAAGTGTAMATRGEAAVIGAESPLTFTLKSPVTISVRP